MNLENIFIISGPSGAGEDSIIEGIKKRIPVEKIITTTTRKMRPGEIDGKDYYFISPEKFQDQIKKGDFAEYAKQYNGLFYGVTKDELRRVNNSGKIGLWKIEYQGVMTAKKMLPNIPAIFIMAENLEILKQRIKNRDGVSSEYVQQRMEYTKEWLKHEDIYDYKVINKQGKLDEAVEDVITIISRHTKNVTN